MMQNSVKNTETLGASDQSVDMETAMAAERVSEQASAIAHAQASANVSERSKVISFRVTPEQYDQIHAQCVNAHGESVLTIGELARQALLTQRVIKPVDIPLTRYRLAVAGEIAMGITELVQRLEYEMDTGDDTLTRLDCQRMLHVLEKIQKTANALLTPINEDVYMDGGAK